jgi:hypothetical protein
VGHQKIGRRILGHLYKKGTRGLSIKDSISIAQEAAQQTVSAVIVDALTQSDLHIACAMVPKPTNALKTAPFS